MKKTKFNQTNRKLGQLEMYGFVNIQKELDPDQANTLNIKIYLKMGFQCAKRKIFSDFDLNCLKLTKKSKNC